MKFLDLLLSPSFNNCISVWKSVKTQIFERMEVIHRAAVDMVANRRHHHHQQLRKTQSMFQSHFICFIQFIE